MVIKELTGKDIMMAYDGQYLSNDFGYSCANFNVKDDFDDYYKSDPRFAHFYNNENDEKMFDFYVKNPKNVSCFVHYNDRGKINGRRMFFKGPSMINDDEFEVPIKKGEPVKYLYGYYGSSDENTWRSVYEAALRKYGRGILYLDKNVLNDGRVDKEIVNLWIMGVDNTNFPNFPPIDYLNVSPVLSALSNFEPRKYITEVLEKDFNKKGVKFYKAYRFSPGKNVRHNYTTWDDHKGKLNNLNDPDDDNITYI